MPPHYLQHPTPSSISNTQLAHRPSGGPRRRAVTMMAVNVPRVLVRPPGQRQYEWVDLWEAYVSISIRVLYVCVPARARVCVSVYVCV